MLAFSSLSGAKQSENTRQKHWDKDNPFLKYHMAYPNISTGWTAWL